jgi:flagellar biogenesis protein FliO
MGSQRVALVSSEELNLWQSNQSASPHAAHQTVTYRRQLLLAIAFFVLLPWCLQKAKHRASWPS